MHASPSLNFWHINGNPHQTAKQTAETNAGKAPHQFLSLTRHRHTSTAKMAEAAPAGAGAAASDLKSGPFGVLYDAVKGNTQVLVNVRNNHKILARVKA